MHVYFDTARSISGKRSHAYPDDDSALTSTCRQLLATCDTLSPLASTYCISGDWFVSMLLPPLIPAPTRINDPHSRTRNVS
mmetsp:Transcript_7098/g.11008  ORF Transcript_7098/g.11008 Transcript_7098/m.11008 type:complete len:81 (-) Transcript_7098:1555-1797(-)